MIILLCCIFVLQFCQPLMWRKCGARDCVYGQVKVRIILLSRVSCMIIKCLEGRSVGHNKSQLEVIKIEINCMQLILNWIENTALVKCIFIQNAVRGLPIMLYDHKLRMILFQLKKWPTQSPSNRSFHISHIMNRRPSV